jgi:chromatin remodeling complex protein RSC6
MPPAAAKKATTPAVPAVEVKEAAPLPVVTPTPEKKTPATKAKQVSVKTPAEVVETPVATGPVAVEGEKEEVPVENVLHVLVEKIGTLTALNKEIQTVLKQVVKEYEKVKKVVDKMQMKREKSRKSPSGFAKPNKISNELCDFIGVPHGTEKSRTDITRYINNYVKEHNLNKPTNRRIILPDEKLKKILNVKDDEEVTFFILQRLISHHFPTKAKPL